MIHSAGLYFAGEESGDESGRLTNERWPRLVAGINGRIEYGKTFSLNKYINIVYCTIFGFYTIPQAEVSDNVLPKREKSEKLFSVLSSLLLFGVSFGTVSLPILRSLPVDKKSVEEKGVEKGLDQAVSEAVDSKKEEEEEGRAVEVKNGVGRGGGGSEIVWLPLSRSPLSPPPSLSLSARK